MAVVFQATVLVSIPSAGLAIVMPDSGMVVVKPNLIARLSYQDTRHGASFRCAPEPGQSVICAAEDKVSKMCVILAPANVVIDSEELSNSGEMTGLIGPGIPGISEVNCDLADEQLTNTGSDAFNYWMNHGHGADRDMLPGDIDITDKGTGAGLHVGEYIVALKGSPLAYIDVSGITNKIRLLASAIERHTITTEHIESEGLCIDNKALNLKEAFGIQDGVMLKREEKEGKVTYTEEHADALPLFRLQCLSGTVIGGTETTVIDFPLEKENVYKKQHDATAAPTILAKHRTSMAGEVSEASALGIQQVKTPYITAIQQLGYGKEPTDGKYKDLRTPFKYEKGEDKEDKRDIGRKVDDAALTKLLDTLLSGDYLELLKAKMAERGLSVSTDSATICEHIDGFDKDAVYKDISGPCNKAGYDLPKHLTITDPVTGKKHMYFASESFISQEPDGSILIADGYGSEIRMSRGNIYISSALDTFIRPGRDCSAMVPGHLALNTQKTLTMNCSESAYIRAVQDLNLTAGSAEKREDRKGSVSISCMSENTSDGIVIQSKGQLAASGKNVYISRNTKGGQATGRVSEPEAPGTIIIDAGGNGYISERSREHVIDASQVAVCGVSGSGEAEGSAVVVNENNIYLNAGMVAIPSTVRIADAEDSAGVLLRRNGETQKYAFKKPKHSGQLEVSGGVAIGGSCKVDKSVQVNRLLYARNIATTQQVAVQTNERINNRIYKDFSIDVIKASDVAATASAVQTASSSVYQDAFMYNKIFEFPQSYGVDKNIRIPGMRWQMFNNMYRKDTSNKWEEQYIRIDDKQTTACYPGYEVWENATISVDGDTEGKLKDLRYIVNTNKKES